MRFEAIFYESLSDIDSDMVNNCYGPEDCDDCDDCDDGYPDCDGDGECQCPCG